jgi:hypothetical protein
MAQRIKPGRKMKWSDVDISFGPEDHPETELSKRDLPFMIKLSIGWHKVAKTLVDNEAMLNLITRKTFIEMGLCHTPFRERGNEASIRVPRMFKSHVRPTIW